VVTDIVAGNVRTDVVRATAATRKHHQLDAAVANDQNSLANATQLAAAAAARVPTDTANLTSAGQQLNGARDRLAAARSTQAAAVAAVVGPASGGLSVLGPAALSPSQLAAWFSTNGYTDLTPAAIDQLAAWYVQQGASEGVRGDVAFAQAVLETGGFSSSDAVTLNNYAGIGHCDTCAAGWNFPSPQAGVLGQLQLLRIFADAHGSPAGAPAPVLPTLTTASQFRSGCCATWEALTGVWATDPTYGAQILGIYQQILSFAVATPSV
jgi:flagellum-specific peptidoglycan hydrolase FlgJ